MTRLRRRGMGLYVMTLSVSLLLAGMGLTLISIQRTDRQLDSNLAINLEAQWYARAGVELALSYMAQVSDWRSRVTQNRLFEDYPVGNGTCTIELYDDTDNSLTDDQTDRVRLVSIGTYQGSSYQIETQLTPRPHVALNYAVFQTSNAKLEFKSNVQIRGPIRSQGELRAGSNVTVLSTSNARFETLQGYSVDSPLQPLTYLTSTVDPPDVDLSWYLSRATRITGSSGSTCVLRAANLTPTTNTEGSVNAMGMYALDADGRDVLIENIHVRGTLIIYDLRGKKVTMDKGGWFEPGPLDYPVLMIEPTSGDIEIKFDSNLPEGALLLGLGGLLGLGVDFNEDGDCLDSHAPRIEGVVWSQGRTTIKDGSWVLSGCIVTPQLIVDNSIKIDDYPSGLNGLKPGFVGTGMALVPGTWKETAP